jgi:hypothetical protein
MLHLKAVQHTYLHEKLLQLRGNFLFVCHRCYPGDAL